MLGWTASDQLPFPMPRRATDDLSGHMRLFTVVIRPLLKHVEGFHRTNAIVALPIALQGRSTVLSV